MAEPVQQQCPTFGYQIEKASSECPNCGAIFKLADDRKGAKVKKQRREKRPVPKRAYPSGCR